MAIVRATKCRSGVTNLPQKLAETCNKLASVFGENLGVKDKIFKKYLTNFEFLIFFYEFSCP